MQDIAYFDRIVGNIYDAVLDPSRWPDALGDAVDYIGGAAGCLVMRDSVSHAGAVLHGKGDKPHYRQLYQERYAAQDPAANIFFCQEVGTVLHYPDFIDRPELEETRYFQEYLLPQGWGDGLFASLAKYGTSIFAFAMARNVDDDRPYSMVRDRAARIAPHLRRAALISDPATDVLRRTKDLSETLDGLAAGVFIVTGGRTLLHTNSAGYAMLERQSPLRTTGGKLVADEKASEDCLDFCMAVSGKEGGGAAAPVSASLVDDQGQAYILHAIPLPADWGLWDNVPVAARVVLFVHRVTPHQMIPKEALARHYGLTPTELRVFCAIVEIGAVPEAAVTMGIAESTVKTHLHRIFAKTGATRQIDLAKIFGQFVSPFRLT